MKFRIAIFVLLFITFDVPYLGFGYHPKFPSISWPDWFFLLPPFSSITLFAKCLHGVSGKPYLILLA
jgi:hypothetical protein